MRGQPFSRALDRENLRNSLVEHMEALTAARNAH
jgi:hypothetical protein